MQSALMSRLTVQTAGAQSLWGHLGHCVEYTGRVVPFKKRGKWIIFFSNFFSSSAEGYSWDSTSGLLCTLAKHVGEILQGRITGVYARESSMCMGRVGAEDMWVESWQHMLHVAMWLYLPQANPCGRQGDARHRSPSRRESCLAQEGLADSLLLLVPSGSSSGLELSYCSAWGDPPANDWVNLWYKGLSILPKVGLL